ncbi:MAG: MBL fold metallo-hydrolase, partial [Pseudomonadales bacterium]|nr:MBL fold metallo-hydrolase [Pseudomonadales bacterium]
MKHSIQPFFDNNSSTYSYVVSDPAQKKCAVIDPVLGFEIKSARTNTIEADKLIQYIQSNHLQLDWILETHVHADHLSAAHYIKQQLGGKIAIGSHLPDIQKTFSHTFDMGTEFQQDGTQFDRLLNEQDHIQIGDCSITVMNTPGHTPACVSYLIGEDIFVGDTLFMPDSGTARCDFPGGDAKALYHSIQRILNLPSNTNIYLCHDYSTQKTENRFVTTVKQQREENIHIYNGVTEAEFITLRYKRDAHLTMPALIIPSIQVNIQA